MIMASKDDFEAAAREKGGSLSLKKDSKWKHAFTLEGNLILMLEKKSTRTYFWDKLNVQKQITLLQKSPYLLNVGNQHSKVGWPEVEARRGPAIISGRSRARDGEKALSDSRSSIADRKGSGAYRSTASPLVRRPQEKGVVKGALLIVRATRPWKSKAILSSFPSAYKRCSRMIALASRSILVPKSWWAEAVP